MTTYSQKATRTEKSKRKKFSPRNRVSPKHKVASEIVQAQLRTIALIATLILAGLAIAYHVDTPVVWTFLCVAIGRLGIRAI